jgi:hypothetical protein
MWPVVTGKSKPEGHITFTCSIPRPLVLLGFPFYLVGAKPCGEPETRWNENDIG